MLNKSANHQDQLVKRLRGYLQSTLHLQLNIEPWGQKMQLPTYLAKEFVYWRGRLLSVDCLFVLVSEDSAATPAELAKRKDQLKKSTDEAIIFVFDHLSAYIRARMIEKGIAFVVPDNQLYIPSLALDLREHFRKGKPASTSSLSPVSQVVLFRHLLSCDHEDWSPSGLAKKLRYSAMSVGRAFDELSANGLASVTSEGRRKILEFGQSREQTFERARDLLRSPVKSSHLFRAPALLPGFYGTTLPQAFPEGGEAALAKLTMINPPRIPCFAVGPKDWKILQTGQFGPEVEFAEDANFSVDVWRYDPDIVTGENQADPLSLYMQFQDHSDERVAGAAVQLLEGLPWFQE